MLGWLLVLHLPAMVLWVGSLLVVTVVLKMHSDESGSAAREVLGRVEARIFRGLTHPGAALALITGLLLITTAPGIYLRAPWLHAKLLLVIFLVALDLRIYFRAKAFQSGKKHVGRGEWMGLHIAVALTFLGILILALVKPF